jgi:hypothetical protein
MQKVECVADWLARYAQPIGEVTRADALPRGRPVIGDGIEQALAGLIDEPRRLFERRHG